MLKMDGGKNLNQTQVLKIKGVIKRIKKKDYEFFTII